MSLPTFLLLVLAKCIVAEGESIHSIMFFYILATYIHVTAVVYFYPSESVVTICGKTTLTCVTTTTGELTWSITAGGGITYRKYNEPPSNPVEIADSIAAKFTAKNNLTLTSVAIIKGLSVALNGTEISCADGVVVSSKVLLIPGTCSNACVYIMK